MNKPLSEWTLAEIKAECKKHTSKCTDCLFWTDAGCRIQINMVLDDYPEKWDLSEPPRWTEQDKEDARALKRLIPDAYIVWRYSTCTALQLYDEYNNYILSLNNCFATLPLRESVMLDEIIGGGNQ